MDRDERALDPLAALARSAPGPGVRTAAVFGLRSLGLHGVPAVPILRELVEADPDEVADRIDGSRLESALERRSTREPCEAVEYAITKAFGTFGHRPSVVAEPRTIAP